MGNWKGQKKNGEMIKYCAVKFSHPNSDRLPIQYPHRTPKLLLVRLSSLRLGKIEASNDNFSDLSSSSGEFCCVSDFLLSQRPAFLVLSPVSVPIRHPK